MLGVRLIEQRLQAGADVQKCVDRDADGCDADGQDGERPGAGQHAGRCRAQQQHAAENEERRVAQPDANQDDP